MSELSNLSSVRLGGGPFIKPTIWQSLPLHALIGQLCGGVEVGRDWTFLPNFLFLKFLHTTSPVTFRTCIGVRDCENAQHHPCLNNYGVSPFSIMTGFAQSEVVQTGHTLFWASLSNLNAQKTFKKNKVWTTLLTLGGAPIGVHLCLNQNLIVVGLCCQVIITHINLIDQIISAFMRVKLLKPIIMDVFSKL